MAKGRHSRGRHRSLGGQLPQTAPPGSATAQLHLLDQTLLDFDTRFCARFFSCLASIPQFYSQFLANQYRLALEYLKLKAGFIFPSISIWR